jgi:RimJ/RimL family protein N-acetyltransferase
VSAGRELRTERLLMRRWRTTDLEPFAASNADPQVMEHFPSTLTLEQSKASIERIEASFEANGYGFWAVELLGEGIFIGFLGLSPVEREMPFAPAVEIGWRLTHERWGHGYATEGARAVTRFAFKELRLAEIVAFTATGNLRSRRVMERLGMTRDAAEDFSHPSLAPEHPLAAHVLYRLKDSSPPAIGKAT